MNPLRIAVTGATGFVGRSLVKAFQAEGFDAIPLSRHDIADGAERLAEKISGADVVINLAGAPIATRWSEPYKKELYASRIGVTETLVRAFELAGARPFLFISASAVGFYADTGKQTEDNFVPAEDFLGRLTWAWEQAALNAEGLDIRTIIFRLGVVLGKGGGALGKMLPPFKLGLGGIIGDGSQPISWVQMKDLERAFITAIKDKSFNGTYNLASPNPTTNKGLTKALGKALNRPTFLQVPRFALRLALGEGADVLIKGQEVYPKRLLDSGFKFSFPDIESAVKASI